MKLFKRIRKQADTPRLGAEIEAEAIRELEAAMSQATAAAPMATGPDADEATAPGGSPAEENGHLADAPMADLATRRRRNPPRTAAAPAKPARKPAAKPAATRTSTASSARKATSRPAAGRAATGTKSRAKPAATAKPRAGVGAANRPAARATGARKPAVRKSQS